MQEKISLSKRIAQESLKVAKDKFKRYLPAELIGTTSAFAGGSLAANLSENNPFAMGYAATATETVGFYGAMIVRQAYQDFQDTRQSQQQYGLKRFTHTAKNLALEFSLAEVLDTPFITF